MFRKDGFNAPYDRRVRNRKAILISALKRVIRKLPGVKFNGKVRQLAREILPTKPDAFGIKTSIIFYYQVSRYEKCSATCKCGSIEKNNYLYTFSLPKDTPQSFLSTLEKIMKNMDTHRCIMNIILNAANCLRLFHRRLELQNIIDKDTKTTNPPKSSHL